MLLILGLGYSGQRIAQQARAAGLQVMSVRRTAAPGIVAFTGLAAGKDTTRAYQVYLSDQPGDLFWLTVKDGKLKETEFKVQPGQQGGLEVERIE